MLLHFIQKKDLKQVRLIGLFAALALFLGQSLSAQNDLWIPKTDLGDGTAPKRSGAISFSISGKIYIGLGKNASTYHNDLWMYDTISGTWSQKADFIGAGRTGAFSMVMNNKAIVGTGEVAGGTKTNTVYKYLPSTNTWTGIQAFAGGNRVFASAFSIGTRGFVVGGDDGSFQNDLWEYNINSDNWIPRASFPGNARIKAVAFTIGANAYYGTGDLGASVLTKDFWNYDISTDSWTQIGDFPGSARAGSIGCSNGTTAYVGLGNDGAFLVDFYTFDGTTWTQKTDLPDDARELAVASAVGDKVFMGTGFGGAYYRDFYQWVPCAKPQISVPPVGLPEICEGTDGQLSVEISNTGGETYEWSRNGTAIPGATSNVLDLIAVTEANHEGSYTCQITNTCGTTTTNPAVFVNVIPLPVGPPTGAIATPDTICPNNNFDITLTSDNNGESQDTLYWYENACGGDIIGLGFPVNNEVMVTPPSPPASTEYFVQWKNQCGESDCDTVFVFAKEVATDPTTILSSHDTICFDFNDSLALLVQGGSGDTVAWYEGNICDNPSAPQIALGDTIDLNALGLIPTETTTYSARWETYCGGNEFHSNCLVIDVVVNGDFSISQQPQNKTFCEGTDSVVFQIGVNEGNSLTDIYYQWFFEGNAISGAQTDTLLVLNVLPSDSGNYYCKVYNTCDTLISDSAFLTVNLIPHFVVEPIIVDTICENDSISFIAIAEGTPELQYDWHFNDVSTGDTDTLFTINPATFNNTGDYYCVVSNGPNTCGVDTSNVVSIEVDTIPFVTQQPVDTTVCLNGIAEFNSQFRGSLPVSYQWYKVDGSGIATIMAGETGDDLIISPVSVADTAFDYYCLAYNECSDGEITDTVSLGLHPPVQIMDSITSDTNNVCYSYSAYIKLTVFGGEGDTIRWFKGACDGEEIHVSTDTTYNIGAPDSTTTYFARWENPCGISACASVTITIAQDPIVMDTLYFEDNNICYNAYDSILLTASGGNGDSIRWYEGFNCNGELLGTTIDTFFYITDINPNSTPYAAQYVNACGESDCLGVDLFIREFTNIIDQTDEVIVCEETESLMYVEVGGEGPFNFQWYLNGAQLSSGTNDTLYVGPISFADTGQYYCEIWTECDTVVSDSIPLTMLELPYIIQQPMDTAVCEGDSAAIQIKTGGHNPALVQWFKNGTAIGSAQPYDTILVINPVIETADYYASVSNTCNITYTDTVTVRAFDTLRITEQPYLQNKCIFDTAEFVVSCDHNEYVEYQWLKLGETNSLGNDSVLIIPINDYTLEGDYYCIISDTCGEISTDTVVLNINKNPGFKTNLFNTLIPCEGTVFQFEVTLLDILDPVEDSIHFNWYQNGTLEPNIDSNVYRFDPVMREDAGLYYVEAFNNCDTIQSYSTELFIDELPDILESVSVTPDTVCPENEVEEITLTAVGDGGGFGDYIEWYAGSVGSANVIGTGQTLTLPIPTTTVEYFARWVDDCTDEDGSGGTFPNGGSHEALSIVLTYQDYPQPPSNLSVNVNDFCITYGDSITLSGQGGYGDVLEWYMMPDYIYLGEGESFTVPQPMDTTVYAAKWTNHCGESDSVTIQVNVVPLPEAIVIEADTICAGQPYEIENVFVDFYDSLRWTSSHPMGYFDTTNIQYPIYYNDTLELYDTIVQYLYLTAYGKADCEDAYDTIKLISTPLPTLAFNPEDPAICRDSVITITASGASEYSWKEVDGMSETYNINPIGLSPVESTEYYLTGTDSRGCIDSITFNLDVYPTPLVEIGDSVFVFSCEPVKLDAGGGDGSEYYIWNNGYRTRSITVYETGNYSVIVGNPGCEVSDTGYISLCNGRIHLPNAFTPNFDGLNEKFKAITADPTLEFRMMIFDRWGKMIFESTDIHEGWDGSYEGEPCPAGNYVWRIDYQGQGDDAPGKKGTEVGTVMLVR